MAKPYVDNWLRTRQSVSDITHNFSVPVLSTDLSATLQGNDAGDSVLKRAVMFNACRDNQGVMLLNKATEEFEIAASPLGTLDALQSQAQEQLASVSSTPLVVLLGLSPQGLNASSEGEIRAYYDWIESFQDKLFRGPLTKIINIVQLHLFGEIDEGIGFKWVSLWSPDKKTAADIEKTKAETGAILQEKGVIDNVEERQRIANDPDTPYQSLDMTKVIEVPGEEPPPGEEPGMEDELDDQLHGGGHENNDPHGQPGVGGQEPSRSSGGHVAAPDTALEQGGQGKARAGAQSTASQAPGGLVQAPADGEDRTAHVEDLT
jgi:hypothetical protein